MNFLSVLHCLKVNTRYYIVEKDNPILCNGGAIRTFKTTVFKSLKKRWYYCVEKISYDYKTECFVFQITSSTQDNNELYQATIEDLKKVTDIEIQNDNNHKYFYICNDGIILIENPPDILFLYSIDSH